MVNIVLSIYNFGYLKYDLTEEELKETFVASNGWWHRFSKRYNLASENLLGEAGSADHKVPVIYYVSTFREKGVSKNIIFCLLLLDLRLHKSRRQRRS